MKAWNVPAFYIDIIKIGMVYISKRQQPHRRKMSAQDHPLVFNERQGNPHTTWQAAADPKTSLYTDTGKELPFYTQVT